MSYNIKDAWKVEKIYQNITSSLRDQKIYGQRLIILRKSKMEDAMNRNDFTKNEYNSWFKSYKIT